MSSNIVSNIDTVEAAGGDGRAGSDAIVLDAVHHAWQVQDS